MPLPLRRVSQFDIHTEYTLPPAAFGITKYDTFPTEARSLPPNPSVDVNRRLPLPVAPEEGSSGREGETLACPSNNRAEEPIRERRVLRNRRIPSEHQSTHSGVAGPSSSQQNDSSSEIGSSQNSDITESLTQLSRKKASTYPSKRLGKPIIYHWSSTSGRDRLSSPPVPASDYQIGDIFLHVLPASKNFQLWVCKHRSRGKRFWATAVAASTPYPTSNVPLVLCYAHGAKRPSWILKKSVGATPRKSIVEVTE